MTRPLLSGECFCHKCNSYVQLSNLSAHNKTNCRDVEKRDK